MSLLTPLAALQQPEVRPARFIMPTAQGSGSGTSWANAAALSAINAQIALARADGGDVWVRADAGTYNQNGAILITNGGTGASIVKIMGVDLNGAPMKPEIKGTRAAPWSIGSANGSEVFRLLEGADHLHFDHLLFRDQGRGCIRVGGPITDLTVTWCDAVNVNTFFENNVSGSSAFSQATINGLTIQNCTGFGYSKRFIYMRYNTNNILIEDCHGDSNRQDGDDFASGVVFYDTAHNAMIRRCQMDNHIDTTRAYQNGDGFAGELGNHDITLEDCGAAFNTDGGVDFKGDNIKIIRFNANRNHRNYRLWGLAELIDCIGTQPQDNAGANPYAKCQVGAFNFAMVRVIGGSFTQSDGDPPFRAEAGGIISLDPATAVTKPSGVPLYDVEPALFGDPPGQFMMMNQADTTVPNIRSVGAYGVEENKFASFPIAFDKVAQLRIVGGRDAAVCTTFGNQIRMPRQDYEDPIHTDQRLRLKIQAHDGNGNASGIYQVTIAINNVSDDAISPAQLISMGVTGGAWHDIQQLSSMWQDLAKTIPAVVGEKVAVVEDLFGFGNDITFETEALRPRLMSEGGKKYLDADGTAHGFGGPAGALQFAKASMFVMQRRGPYATAAQVWSCVPRSNNQAAASNGKYWLGVIGGASVSFRIDPVTSASNGVGAVVGQDTILSLRTETGVIRSNVAVVADIAGTANLTSYPVGARPRIFCDGNDGSIITGRFYGHVITNRTEDDETCFRIERQLAANVGIEL